MLQLLSLRKGTTLTKDMFAGCKKRKAKLVITKLGLLRLRPMPSRLAHECGLASRRNAIAGGCRATSGHDGMLAGQRLEVASDEARLEARRHRAQVHEYRSAGRTVEDIDSLARGGRFCGRDRVGIDVERRGLPQVADDGLFGDDIATADALSSC